MAASPFSDGTPQASQWPIPPRYFFDYEILPEIGMAGTYFYHSHVGFQAVSAAGPLIVEDAGKVPYGYDEERIIFFSDVFNKTNAQIEHGLQSNPFVWSGETLNVMINGKGQLAGCGSLATIDVQPGKTYRLRFIGGTALSFVSLGFEDHQMTIIEADGSYTKPFRTDILQIGSGQRFSVLLHTKPRRQLQGRNQFFLQVETRNRPTLTRSYAVLKYGGGLQASIAAPRTPPLSLPNTTYQWLEYQLRPLRKNNFPQLSEVTRRVVIRTHQMVSGNAVWAQDNVPWFETFPKEPYLVSLYKNDGLQFPSYDRAIANGGVDPETKAFPAKIGEVIELVIQNTGSDSGGIDVHPFHAHGAHYYDIGSGNGTYDIASNEARLRGTEPVMRDTTMLFRYGEKTVPGVDASWRAWRLRITEPGVWMIHCHILQHMIMGMQTVWVMGNQSELLKVPYPDVTGYLDYGGSVYGNDSYSPRVVQLK